MTEPSDMEEKLNKIAHTAQPDQAFSEELWQKIESAPQQSARKASGFAGFIRKPAWSIPALLITALLIFVAAKPQVALAAFRSLFGYIPGIGFVEDSENAKSIAEPIQITQDGVTLTIEQAIADADKTVISYAITASDSASEGFDNCFYDSNQLQLSNGKTLLPTGGGVEGHSARIEFFPLPNGESAPTLLIKRQEESSQCNAPVSFSVPIPFTSDIAPEQIAPVYEGEQIHANTGDGSINEAADVNDNPYQIRFLVDRLAVMNDIYLIAGHAEWDNPEIYNVRVDPHAVRLQDASGKKIAIEESDQGEEGADFAFRFSGDQLTGPLTLSIDSVYLWYQPVDKATFTVNTGDNPQSDQQWDINRRFTFDGQQIFISTMALNNKETTDNLDCVNGYTFMVDISAAVNYIDLGFVPDKTTFSYFGLGKTIDADTNMIKICFPETLPTGEITFSVNLIQYNKPGSWSVQWQLPENSVK